MLPYSLIIYITESTLLSDISYVLCLDTIGQGDSLRLHVSKPPKEETPAQDFVQVCLLHCLILTWSKCICKVIVAVAFAVCFTLINMTRLLKDYSKKKVDQVYTWLFAP